MKVDFGNLIDKALEARERAYAPYSNFRVGAALLCENGKIFQGCNIENAAYSPSNCAERTAFFKAVSEGEKDFLAIAIVGGRDAVRELCAPCGVCRQVMAEFCSSDFAVVSGTSRDNFKVFKLSELFPFGFSKNDLN